MWVGAAASPPHISGDVYKQIIAAIPPCKQFTPGLVDVNNWFSPARGRWRSEVASLLEEHSVRDAEQSVLLPVFLVLGHLGWQRLSQVFAGGAVEVEQVGSQEVPEGRKGQRTIGEERTNRSN